MRSPLLLMLLVTFCVSFSKFFFSFVLFLFLCVVKLAFGRSYSCVFVAFSRIAFIPSPSKKIKFFFFFFFFFFLFVFKKSNALSLCLITKALSFVVGSKVCKNVNRNEQFLYLFLLFLFRFCFCFCLFVCFFFFFFQKKSLCLFLFDHCCPFCDCDCLQKSTHLIASACYFFCSFFFVVLIFFFQKKKKKKVCWFQSSPSRSWPYHHGGWMDTNR